MDSNELFTYEDELADGEVSAQSAASAERSENTYKKALRAERIKKKKQLKALGIVSAVFLVLCAILMLLSSSGNGRVFPVYMTEILASNTSYPNSDGRCCDYIELYNSADYAVDLSGFQLGDVAGNNRYQFPAGTTIGPGEYLVIYCDKTAKDEAYAQFGISRAGGEAFYLIGTSNAIVDSVITIPTDLDQSMILQNGEWVTSSTVTPGRSNDEATENSNILYNPDVSPVRITEISSTKTGYSRQHGVHCDWVELHNTGTSSVDISGYRLSDNVGVDKYIFPEGTVLAPDEYIVVLCTDEVRNETLAPFGLSQVGGESVVLKNEGGMIIEIVDCIPMNDGESLELSGDDTWTTTRECSPGFANGSEGHAAYLETVGLNRRSVVVSEVMAANQTVFPDCFGEFSDWVELYNIGSEAVDLTGWYLSDNPDDWDKWEFPQLVIQPGERVLVFCSGRDTVQDGQLHTGFSLSASGDNLVLSSYMGIAADSVTFGASEDSCSFVFNEASEPVQTVYPTPGYSNDDAGYEQFCTTAVAKGPLAIWEVMTANDWYLPQTLGACYDWAELRNISDTEINLSDYSITDDADAPLLYTLPDKTLAPGESIVIILSGDVSLSTSRYDHAGFTLNAKEDQLLLFRNDGSLLDYVYLREIPRIYSYGRSEETGGFFYMEPTPNEPNNSGPRLISAMPISDIAAGVYTTNSSCSVPFSAAGNIYYTTDGSDPDVTSLKYEGPIQVEETSVIRAISVEDGKLPSEIYTLTFVIQEPHSIPVVSLVTDPDNLWGANGIYKNGDITIKEEKRTANVAYTGEDGSFSLDCEISLHGDTTVTAFDKKSFSLRFQDSYDGRLNYDVFGDGEVTTFKSLILRTAYEDYYSSQIRDALIGYVASQASDSVISQKFKYVAVYLNGEYWGLYALRELHSEEHFASYMDVPASTVTMVRDMTYGSPLHPVYNFVKNGGTYRSDSNYEKAKALFDLESFADWMIFQAYVSNFDILGNTRYYYTSTDGLWRCGLVDLDLGMFRSAGFRAVTETLHHGYLMKALLANEEFQDLLATRMAELLAGPMSDENMMATIDMMADTIRDEVPLERERWGGNLRNWEKMVTQLKDYCDGRAVELIYNLCDVVGFSRSERTKYFGDILASYGKN